MCNSMVKISLIVAIFVVAGCQRMGPSPVDVKIDDTVVGGTHVVSNNETLFDIAYRYNIDPMNLADINGIKPPYVVKNGQILQLPDASSQTRVSSAAGVTNTGYNAIETNSSGESNFENISDEKDVDQEKKKEENGSDIDDDFNSMMSSSSKSSGKHTAASEKSAKELATPKVTATAMGTPTEAAKAVAANPSVQKKSLRMPVEGRISSHFGDMNDGVTSEGINIVAPKGSKVLAAADGKVIYASNKIDEEYGRLVMVQHDNGLITSYAHMDSINVKKGAHIVAGESIGTVGQTGDVDEPQLYFAVIKNKNPVDPLKYLKK